MDGSVFVVTGRAMGIKTELLQDDIFLECFVNQNPLWDSGYRVIGEDNTIT